MSKLLTCIRYAASKIYPAKIDLSSASTFYVPPSLTIGQRSHDVENPSS